MKKFNLKKISQAVALGIMSTAIGFLPSIAHTSDIEIYRTPESGKKTVMMMLDTSGSMLACDGIKEHVETSNDKYMATDTMANTVLIDSRGIRHTGSTTTVERTSNGVKYTLQYCNIGPYRNEPSRATRLLEAMFNLLDSDSLDDSVILGVGSFNYLSGKHGTIAIPAKPLTAEHRQAIRRYLAELKFGNGTPVATSYAEVAAYMMGTTTKLPLVDNGKSSYKEVYSPSGNNVASNDPNAVNNSWGKCTTWSAVNPAACTRGDLSSTVKASTLRAQSNLKEQICLHFGGRYTCWADTRQPINSYMPKEMKDAGLPYNPNNLSTVSGYEQYIGFDLSADSTKTADKTRYKSPLPENPRERECSGQAIYFLTDGFPNNVYESQYIMRAALGNKADASPAFPKTGASFANNRNMLWGGDDTGIGQVGEFSKRLRNPALNPAGVQIKTAVVGFGSVFAEAEKYKKTVTTTNSDTGKSTTRVFYDCSKITNVSIRNACYWGGKSYEGFTAGYGEGGFFYAQNSQDVIDSLLQVVADVETKTGELATGSPSIPFDPLVFRAATEAYYASFTPVPEKPQRFWTGNMNKYNVTQGRLLSGSNNVPLFKEDGNYNDKATGLWDTATGKGVLGQLVLKKQNNAERMVYTNRVVSGSTASNGTSLKQVNVSSLYSFAGAFRNDPLKNYWLNLLGYAVPATGEIREADLPNQAELRQLGASMHSLPAFITQQATIGDDNNISNRQDYVVYGSTQGLLHIVDAKTGKEKLAFAPHEMIEKQKEAFLAEALATGSSKNLFYGIDASWVAHSVYAETSAGVTTVQSQKADDGAHQWLYGGLRMGGKSYYALDVSNLDKPEMLFHIDPENKKVHSKNTKTYEELSKMGQSWSKPALGYVNWTEGGKTARRLVMFVGGGYDMGYEETNYKQTNKEGAGVYMFDASTGDLLWWASSEAVGGGQVPRLNIPELKYSVVTRINTLDRDGDTLIDALYFGDLGGQAFRIDLNNKATSVQGFAASGTNRNQLLFSEHKEDGTSPRFYEMPDLAVYTQGTADGGDGKAFLAVSFTSGDRSSPLAGTNTNLAGETKVRPTAKDGVFVVYDADVGRPDLHDVNFVSRHTSNVLLESNFTQGIPQKNGTTYNRGWKYIHDGVAGEKKFMLEPFSFGRTLFVNAYNKDGQGITGQCGAGVAGNSTVLSFCMPTGKCDLQNHGHNGNPDNPSKPNESILGVGLQGATVGGDSTKQDVIAIVGGAPERTNCTPETAHLVHCRQSPIPPKINQLRWYESN